MRKERKRRKIRNRRISTRNKPSSRMHAPIITIIIIIIKNEDTDLIEEKKVLPNGRTY